MTLALFIFTCILTVVFTIYKFKYGFFFFLLCFLVYPRVLSLGVTGEGLVLSMARAQLIIISVILLYRLIFVENEYKRIKNKIDVSKYILILPILFVGWKIIVSILNTGFQLTIISGLINDFLLGIMLVLITLSAINKVNDLISISKILFVGLLINFIAGLIEFQLGRNLFEGIETTYTIFNPNVDNITRFKYGELRMQAFFSGPLLLAFFSVLSFPFLIRLIELKKHIFFNLALIFIPLIIYFTKSRASILLLALVILFWVIKKQDIQIKQKFFKNFLLSTLTICLLALTYNFRFEIFGLVNLLLLGQNISILDDRSVLERIDQFNVFRNVDSRVFILGLGRMRYLPEVTDAINNLDNYFVRTFLEAGIVGLFILLLFFLVIYKESVYVYEKANKYNYKSLKEWAWTLKISIILTFLVCNLSSNTIINLFIFSFPVILVILKRRIHQIELSTSNLNIKIKAA